ncbi:DUF3383 family protein, partial [Bordetella avium]
LVQGGVDKGLRNGTVVVGKTLTALQKVAIGQMTNDPLAWHDVKNKGYWHTADVTQSTDESGATEYAVKYLLVYSKGDMIRKVEGS